MNNKLKNILIVDDSNITRNLIEHVYNSKYNVVTAVNGKEAVNYINTVNIDTVAAILLDLNMPEVDGFDVFVCIVELFFGCSYFASCFIHTYLLKASLYSESSIDQ